MNGCTVQKNVYAPTGSARTEYVDFEGPVIGVPVKTDDPPAE